MKTRSTLLFLLIWLFFPGISAIAQGNHIRTFRPQEPVKKVAALQTASSMIKTNLYLDGLGREIQLIQQGASPGGGDIVQPIHYDAFGRLGRQYMPYAIAAPELAGDFRPGFEAEHAAFHQQHYAGDAFGYQETTYQPSALQIPQSQSPPGKAWQQGSGRETEYQQRPNLAEEQVRIWTIDENGLPLTQESFEAGKLWVNIISDGEGMRSLVYTDRLGRVILKKIQATDKPTQAHTGWHCTYYIYDILGDLRAILPPKAIEVLDSDWQRSGDADLAEGLYFLYQFDGKKRLIEKKSPGKGKEEYLYDRRDRLVGSRDGNLLAAGKWRYTRYDVHNRPVKTGITTDERERETLQKILDGEDPHHEQPTSATGRVRYGQTISSSSFEGHERYTAAKAVILKPGFHFIAQGKRSFAADIGPQPEKMTADGNFPREEGRVLTVNYYDDYSKSKKAFQNSPSLPATGFYTGGLVRADLLTERAVHYDKEGRVINLLKEDHLEGESRQTFTYDFSGRILESNTRLNGSVTLDYSDSYSYSPEGYLNTIQRRMSGQTETLVARYAYGMTGELATKNPGGLAPFHHQRHIRGWTSAVIPEGKDPSLFSFTLSHETGTKPLYNGHISEMVWKGRDGQQRKYLFGYDPAGRLREATYAVPGSPAHQDRYSLRDLRYDANGNILSLTRSNRQAAERFGEVDRLSYGYAPHSNRLESISDAVPNAGFEANDFSASPAGDHYRYDANGNLIANPDKGIRHIRYNHLDLPEEMVFDTGEKLLFAYLAEGILLSRKAEKNGKTVERTDYLGELILKNGHSDQLLHPEGRFVYENENWLPEFFVRDHLGSVRQVLRKPLTTTLLASMEPVKRNEEIRYFEGIDQNRQAGIEHNSTPGGSYSAWLNASRGRILGPARRQQVQIGEQVRLSVKGKYRDSKGLAIKPETFISTGARTRLLDNLTEFRNTPVAAGNPLLWFSLADLLIRELQTKPVPEAYMLYVLYDEQGKIYRKEKRSLTKNAAGKHELLEANFYIEKDGHLEAFLVNETEADVWFDDFQVQTQSALVVQEDHYDPWGLPLSGLEYRAADREESRYGFNGGSYMLERIGLYQTPNRLYDPALGRFWGMDKLSDMYTSISPMAFGFNNPLLFSDPTGLYGDCKGCPEFQLPAVTVSSMPDRSSRMQLESQLQLMRQSRNPVYRNLGMTAYREGMRAARDLYQRGRKLHFSETDAQASRNSRYLDGIGMMVSYGITGSMVAAAASPVLLRGLVDGLGARAVQRMGMEAGLQMGMSLVFNGNFKKMDFADIGMAGLFGKWAFASNALIDIKPDQGFSTSLGIGNKKSLYETSIDIGIGGYNRSFNQLLKTSEINKNVIKTISSINGTSRMIVGETMKIHSIK
ncbi:RHS repeat-associated core domain-containing protein [Cyclobacterium lianum]|uniref:RHS repeat-associated core domain-containing protein n=1 Tax=Cyclobacterium lianum TaxID=388280 RepID=A0A1M7PYF8_9BACT|nr:DUF6443 domain-containing protein [Cyclobacterium lianum]SHN22755.1 RHS repeat-associated core domain-containing protein [Cyclobacterium lianum]